MANRKKGHLTFKSAAVFIILSAAAEIISPTAEVPLFDRVFGGAVAFFYHAGYGALYLALGIGLWRATHWGYLTVFLATGLYTLDKLPTLAFPDAAVELMLAQIGRFGGVSASIDTAVLQQAVQGMTVTGILCWWGFALYTYFRRAYFDPPSDA